MGGRVTAVQVRQYVRVGEDGPAVYEHESARMLTSLQTRALHLDEALEGRKGTGERRRKLCRLVLIRWGDRSVVKRFVQT